MDGMANDVRAHYTGDSGSNVADRVRALLETLRPGRVPPETKTIEVIFGIHAKAMGISPEQFRGMMEGMSHTRRSPTLKELTDAAVFAAKRKNTAIAQRMIKLSYAYGAILFSIELVGEREEVQSD